VVEGAEEEIHKTCDQLQGGERCTEFDWWHTSCVWGEGEGERGVRLHDDGLAQLFQKCNDKKVDSILWPKI